MVDGLRVEWLVYGVFALWVAAGCTDYVCHRVSQIELTSGRVESSLHAVQYAQIVAGIVLALFFEATSLVLVMVIALALLHLATGFLDVSFTTGRRYISPLEQHVHSYMEILPLVATALLVLLNWSTFAAIFDGNAASWSVSLRRQLPPAGVFAMVAFGLAAAGVAIAEEYIRCSRHLAVSSEGKAPSVYPSRR